MPKVTFLPMNITVEAQPGQRILDIAIANNVEIPHACGGSGVCGMCLVSLKEGVLSEKNEDTEGIFAMAEESRLACVAKVVNSDVVIEVG